jgi:S-adenosylmethionine uptake transporter
LLSWFNKKGYFQGVFWIIMVALVSNTNDILMRLLGMSLPPMEIAFFRFLFATITLLPVMIYHGPSSFYTKRPILHCVRSVLLFGAIACWVMGLSMVHLVVASTLALTTNLFVLPMASVFLAEKVGWQRTVATLIGFIGVFIVVYESSVDKELVYDFMHSGNGAVYLIAATMMFALSDIVNKKFVGTESTLPMMFYIALGTTLIGLVPAYLVWVMPSLKQLFLLLLLGAGGNAILYCLLKAFSATDVSALSPYRYTELFSAGILGFIIFQEVPSPWTILAAALIIPCTFWIATVETKNNRRKISTS